MDEAQERAIKGLVVESLLLEKRVILQVYKGITTRADLRRPLRFCTFAPRATL